MLIEMFIIMSTQKLLISIDLETHGQNPAKCAIGAIGMAAYAWEHGCVDEYSVWIDPKSALQYGEADADTTAWWAKQPEIARRQMTDGKVSINDALTVLAAKIAALNTNPNSTIIVARAPSFDCAILARHFDLLAIQCPWKYWQERDHRTFEDCYRGILAKSGNSYFKYLDMHTVAHDALLDAKTQATYLINLKAEVEKSIRK